MRIKPNVEINIPTITEAMKKDRRLDIELIITPDNRCMDKIIFDQIVETAPEVGYALPQITIDACSPCNECNKGCNYKDGR
jgi:MinD superfamily P-loop ATPase